MGGGSNSSGNTSRPLTAPERQELFWASTKSLGGSYDKDNNIIWAGEGNRHLPVPEYTGPGYVAPDTAQTLSGGDYDALQKSLYSGATAGLDKFYADQSKGLDQSLADRGIWSSGIAVEAQNDLSGELASSYQKAGADAASQRYQMQLAEMQGLNQEEMQRAAMANSFNQAQADQTFNAEWAPLEYLMGLWNETGGTIGKGKSSGWNFSL